MGGNQMNTIDRLIEMQDAGSPICPRCGRWTMVQPITHNAMSRVAENVYVCNDCGMDEALRDFGRIPLPVNEWTLPLLWKEKQS